MAIPQEEYINITSGVAQDAVSNRELIGRYITPNALFSGATEYTNAPSVGDNFGYDSNEYYFARKYFDFISKDVKRPKKLSFFKLPKLEDINNGVGTTIVCDINADILAEITDESQGITIRYKHLNESSEKEISVSFDGVSGFGGISSVSDLVTYINRSTPEGYKADSYGDKLLFVLKTTSPVEVLEVYDEGSLISGSPQVSQGIPAFANIAEALDYMDNLSNNFGTFTFDRTAFPLSSDDIKNVSEWNASKNVKYIFVCGVESTNYSIVSTDLKDVDGTWLQLVDDKNPYACFAPMAIGATFNYNKANTNAFFDFYPVNGLETQVSDYETYKRYVLARVNFNGQTQQAGGTIDFLQPGYLTGAISDAGVYYNEMWIKDDLWTRLMALFLAVKKIPANEVGKIQCKGVMMNTINQALVNGSILVGKTLTSAQKAQIEEYTNDENAVNKIQENGYYLDLNVERTTFADSNKKDVEKYIVSYSLLYAKGDGIRKVEGTNILY